MSSSSSSFNFSEGIVAPTSSRGKKVVSFFDSNSSSSYSPLSESSSSQRVSLEEGEPEEDLTGALYKLGPFIDSAASAQLGTSHTRDRHTLERLLEFSRFSRVQTTQLGSLRDLYSVPREIILRVPESGEEISNSRGDFWSITVDLLRYGIWLPSHIFVGEFLAALNVVPSQLLPQAWAHISSYLVMCARKCIQPTIGLFGTLYRVTRSGWVLKVKPTASHHILSDISVCPDEEASFGCWLLVSGGFAPQVPKRWVRYGCGREYPRYRGVSSLNTMHLSDECGGPFKPQCLLRGEVLAAAGL